MTFTSESCRYAPMGLSTILIAAQFFVHRHERNNQRQDVEKAELRREEPYHEHYDDSAPNVEEHDGREGDLVVEEEDEDEREDRDGEELEDVTLHASSSQSRSRRFGRFSTLGSTLSGSSITRTWTGSFSSHPWLTRAKTLLFPRTHPEELERYVPTYRYSPIISGILIPFSILLEVPGLTEYCYFDRVRNICEYLSYHAIRREVVDDYLLPPIALSLVFLDVIDIIAVTVFGVVHRKNDGFTYGQAFWMTLCSTIASTITNITLILDYIRIPDFAHSDTADIGSGLTRKQRSLMIMVIVVLMYLALGAVVNSRLLSLSFINGLYYSTVCIETIGFGDIVPNTTGGRVFACMYIPVGMVILGIVISICRSTVLEGLNVGYRKRLRRLRERRRAARQSSPVWVSDKEWRENEEGIRFVGLGGEAEGADAEFWFIRALRVVGMRKARSPSVRSPHHVPGHPHGKHLNINALTRQQLGEAALEAGIPPDKFIYVSPARRIALGDVQEADTQPLPHRGWPANVKTPTEAQLGRMATILTKVAFAVSGRDRCVPGPSSEVTAMAQHAASEGHNTRIHERNSAERVQAVKPSSSVKISAPTSWYRKLAARSKKWLVILRNKLHRCFVNEQKNASTTKLTVAWGVFLLFWFVGSAIFSATEGWSYGIAMYFCVISFTTTGFGDYAPMTPAGRSIFVVWALFGVGTLTILVAVIEDAGSSRYQSAMHSRAFDKAVAKYRKDIARETARVSDADCDLHNIAGVKDADAEITTTNGRTTPVTTEDVASRLDEAQKATQCQLEALPGDIVTRARVFRDYLRYFEGDSSQNADPSAEGAQTNVPIEVRRLLDEIVKSEGVGERVKREILQDSDARRTLFILGVERILRGMIGSAQQALDSVADRNSLQAISDGLRHEADASSSGPKGTPDAGSISTFQGTSSSSPTPPSSSSLAILQGQHQS
ncbi:uncharacterized protein FIBRA_03247 [Fibroporia radiculosa]|uniref:Potassium channel domain-containing protein n=1 Tax=Fibroporia radiculosa TaxID=599839 RepID=J4H2A8_9APHY|nr:uncharacterized protein FIBRA_03247 [Fibroporia radiculosa]CCM01199.1 predicted protein [Fibroporia radiculosa]